MDAQTEELLLILKTISDESRLTLIRLLNQREYTVGDLAEKINLTEPTVSHHLARLRLAGLVNLRTAGNQRLYRINPGGLERFRQLVTDMEQIPTIQEPISTEENWLDKLNWSDEDKKVLSKYIRQDKLTHLPNKQKKMQVILRWLITLFQPDRFYNELEVNQILKNVYEEDFISLRRDLVDMGYLRRERGGGKYWLTPADEQNKR